MRYDENGKIKNEFILNNDPYQNQDTDRREKLWLRFF